MQPMAVDMDGATTELSFPARYGQHTEQVLAEVGLSTVRANKFSVQWMVCSISLSWPIDLVLLLVSERLLNSTPKIQRDECLFIEDRLLRKDKMLLVFDILKRLISFSPGGFFRVLLKHLLIVADGILAPSRLPDVRRVLQNRQYGVVLEWSAIMTKSSCMEKSANVWL